jgi:hypothetical protein
MQWQQIIVIKEVEMFCRNTVAKIVELSIRSAMTITAISIDK